MNTHKVEHFLRCSI